MVDLTTGHTQAIRTECALRGLNRQQTAYILATTRHETGGTMQPVVENLRYTTAERIHAVWPSRFPTVASAKGFVLNPEGLANKVYGGRMGNKLPTDGWTYRGRGFVQITGRENYETATRELRVDLVGNPDLALKGDIAARILVAGMAEGWFTGRKLAQYQGAVGFDYVEARRIVNGTDKAEAIAAIARQYEAALSAAAVAAPPATSPWADLFAAIARLFNRRA